jgi:multiple sugar transport system permease protein
VKKNAAGWLFSLPAALHLLVFAFVPIGYALFISLYDWNVIKGQGDFVAAGNYLRIFQDDQFLRALGNSGIYTLFGVPLGAALALAVALLLAKNYRESPIFRTIFYMPSVCSQAAIAMVWIFIFLPKKGMINSTLGWVGLPDGTDFLNDPSWAMAALIFMSIWVSLGPKMILYIAGILNIPETLYEAARLDGATDSQQFWRITLPLLGATTVFVLVTSTIGALQVFTPVYMMTKGGPDGATDVVGWHIYSAAWERFELGEASAMSFVLFGAVLLAAVLQVRLMKDSMGGHQG